MSGTNVRGEICVPRIGLARYPMAFSFFKLPVQPCGSYNALCRNVPRVDLDDAYLNRAEAIAGHQLAKAGFRLANLLNRIWTAPVSPSDVPRAANSASAEVVSSQTVAGQIVGNRRSKIYAWPECGTYDRMSTQNRVLFPSREAAEQAGYRAAFNCP